MLLIDNNHLAVHTRFFSLPIYLRLPVVGYQRAHGKQEGDSVNETGGKK